MRSFLTLLLLLPHILSGAEIPEEPAILPHWPAKADGFASVEALGQNGTVGGHGGPVVVVNNLAELEKYAAAEGPHIILIEGTIEKKPFGERIPVSSDKTILGLGADATILHAELFLRDVSNVIIRNLTIRDSLNHDDPKAQPADFDAIQIDNSHHIWIDHCHFSRMQDGLIDFRKESDYLTVSWCILSHHNKAFGVGWSESLGKRHVTIHHTWIHDTNQRNPSLDNGVGHLYNNWLQNISSYGVYSRGRSKLVVESSVFDGVKDPLTCAPEAELISRGNLFLNCSPKDSDRTVPRGVAFDPREFYSYQLNDPTEIRELLKRGAGPQRSLGIAP